MQHTFDIAKEYALLTLMVIAIVLTLIEFFFGLGTVRYCIDYIEAQLYLLF